MLRDLTERVAALERSSDVPTGVGVWWPGTAGQIPSGFFAQGAELDRDRHRGLFDIYGTEHGAGNGQTTFVLPVPDPVDTTGLWIFRA